MTQGQVRGYDPDRVNARICHRQRGQRQAPQRPEPQQGDGRQEKRFDGEHRRVGVAGRGEGGEGDERSEIDGAPVAHETNRKGDERRHRGDAQLRRQVRSAEADQDVRVHDRKEGDDEQQHGAQPNPQRFFDQQCGAESLQHEQHGVPEATDVLRRYAKRAQCERAGDERKQNRPHTAAVETQACGLEPRGKVVRPRHERRQLRVGTVSAADDAAGGNRKLRQQREGDDDERDA